MMDLFEVEMLPNTEIWARKRVAIRFLELLLGRIPLFDLDLARPNVVTVRQLEGVHLRLDLRQNEVVVEVVDLLAFKVDPVLGQRVIVAVGRILEQQHDALLVVAYRPLDCVSFESGSVSFESGSDK